MSNHLAIATVTATLRQLLQNAVTQDVTGASVEILPLNDNKLKDNAPILNLFLYHVAPNAAWRNAELPTRREDATVATRPHLALNLYYMLTAFGRATQTDPEPHRLLGSAVRSLHERPVLTRTDIRSVVQSHTALTGSDLAEQVELVRVSPQHLSLEELSKLWSVFFQTPYRVSLAYEAAVVLIDGKSRPHPALPVQIRNVYVTTLRAPLIEAVESAAGAGQAILAGGSVVIRGVNLRGDITRVRVGALEVTPPAEETGDERIQISLPAALRAGVLGAQVVHRVLMGTPETEHAGTESNVAAFVLRPRIQRNAADTAWEIAVSVTSGTGTQPRGGIVTVELSPDVERTQRVVLFLNEIDPPADRLARAYSFEAPSRAMQPAETTDTIAFPFSGVVAGSYLVRVQVDGAESPVTPGAGSTFSEPQAVIP